MCANVILVNSYQLNLAAGRISNLDMQGVVLLPILSSSFDGSLVLYWHVLTCLGFPLYES